MKAQFRALYGQSQPSLPSLPTYYSSYLPISYHLPAQPPAFLDGGQEDSLLPPGELQQARSRLRSTREENYQAARDLEKEKSLVQNLRLQFESGQAAFFVNSKFSMQNLSL